MESCQLKSNNDSIRKTEDFFELKQLLKDEIYGIYIPKGIIFMFLSCFFKILIVILCQIFLKGNPKISYFGILTFKSFFLLIMSICSLLLFKIDIFHKNFIKKESVFSLFLIPLLGISSMTILVYSLRNVDISNLNFCFSIFPALIILFSYFLLGEKLNSFDYLCMILCSVANIQIMKPEIIFNFHHTVSNNFPLILVIISAIFKCFEFIIIRYNRNDFHFLVFPLFYALIGLIIYSITMFSTTYTYPVLTKIEILNLFLIGMFTFFHLLFMILALKNEKAGSVSLIIYIQIALLLISEILFLNRHYNIDEFIGSLFIICLILINLFVKVTGRKLKLREFMNIIKK